MAKLPQFAGAGTLDIIQSAIDSGVLTYPAYVYIRDTKHLAFIDQDLSINEIVGNNPKSIENVEVLPDVSEARNDVFYICEDIVYRFDGEDFVPLYKDVTPELEALRLDIENLTSRVEVLEGKPGLLFDSKELFPEVGEENTLYVATNEPAIYIWDLETNTYVPFTSSTSTIQWIEL